MVGNTEFPLILCLFCCSSQRRLRSTLVPSGHLLQWKCAAHTSVPLTTRRQHLRRQHYHHSWLVFLSSVFAHSETCKIRAQPPLLSKISFHPDSRFSDQISRPIVREWCCDVLHSNIQMFQALDLTEITLLVSEQIPENVADISCESLWNNLNKTWVAFSDELPPEKESRCWRSVPLPKAAKDILRQMLDCSLLKVSPNVW